MPDVIEVPCFCRGVNPACVQCGGVGTLEKAACKRCAGKGTEASSDKKCLDCRGAGWRDLSY